MPTIRARALALLLPLLLLTACGGRGGNPACGLASVAGANLLLGAFSTPNITLSAPPRRVPVTLQVRVVAGPLYRATVTRTDSLLEVTLLSDSTRNLAPGSGVLIQDTTGRTRGVVLFDAPPVARAPVIGTVVVGSHRVPLVGITADPDLFADARCPLFPDSTGP